MVFDNDEAACLKRIDGHHDIKIVMIHASVRMPLHMGATPRILMAHLPEQEIVRIIRERGLLARTKYTVTSPRILKGES